MIDIARLRQVADNIGCPELSGWLRGWTSHARSPEEMANALIGLAIELARALQKERGRRRK